MATNGLREAITFMEDYGLYDVILPFMLVFTIIFATLQKIQIFGKESRRYNVIIAFVIAFMFVAATKLVDALNNYLPVVGLVLALFLGLMLILGIFGVKEGSGTQKLGWILAGFVTLVVGASFIPKIELDFLEPILKHKSAIIVVIIIIGIIAWVVKGESEPKKA